MIVRVTNLYSGTVRTFQGDPEQVQRQLRHQYGWLRHRAPDDTLQQDLARLHRAQALLVEVDGG